MTETGMMSDSAVHTLDWATLTDRLLRQGFVTTGAILSPAQCDALVAGYTGDHYRKHVQMARHNFGRGDYKYFSYPLPPLIATLREQCYARLASAARLWAERVGVDQTFPDHHPAFIDQCHAAGQTRPTPLILKYGPNDYNCLHQDLYGALYFPFQMVFMLSRPGTDFTGGELVLTETRPRLQSIPHVASVQQGEAMIFAVKYHPAVSKTGYARRALRHGVSEIHNGQRYTLGLIFHDAA